MEVKTMTSCKVIYSIDLGDAGVLECENKDGVNSWRISKYAIGYASYIQFNDKQLARFLEGIEEIRCKLL